MTEAANTDTESAAPDTTPLAGATPPEGDPSPSPEPKESATPTPEPKKPEESEKASSLVKSPEDYDVPEYVTPEMRQFAADNGMSQEQFTNTIAQFGTLLNARANAEKTQIAQLGKQQLEAWGEDSEYKLTLARRALKQNDPDGNLARMLEETGFGSHPAVLQFLSNLGSTMKEGGFLKGASVAPSAKTTAQKMFPNMVSNPEL